MKKTIELKNFKPGDILLSPPNSWIGRSIVALTKGEVSHSVIFCGLIDNEPKIAHSFLSGLLLSSLHKFMVEDGVPFYHVMRHTSQKDLRPVVSIAQKYIEKGSSYPFGNLLVLGMLLAYKKLSPDILNSKAYCDFMALVAMKTMRHLRDFLKRGKNCMTCSQFVSQCFTDAEESTEKESGIRFSNLVIDRVATRNALSLAEMLCREVFIASDAMVYIDAMPEMSPEQEDRITNNFIQMMSKSVEPVSIEETDKRKLFSVGSYFVSMLEKINGSRNMSSVKMINTYPDQSRRNYFVTSDDLLSNAENLMKVGVLDNSFNE